MLPGALAAGAVTAALSQKQRKAVQAALPSVRKQLMQYFASQPRKQQQPQNQQRRRRRQFDPANLARMPAQIGMRGVMPDLNSHKVWSQTPASSNVIAPRGFGYYDAYAHNAGEVMTYASIGPATPITATTICDQGIKTLTSAPDGSDLQWGARLLVVYPSASAEQARLYTFNPDGNNDSPINIKAFSSPQLNLDPPDDCIPTRCSVRIRNVTQQMAVGGVVRVLRLTTGFAVEKTAGVDGIATTNGELGRFVDGIRTHERTRTYGGDELVTTHQKNCSVVDQSRATHFTSWDMKIKAQELPWTFPLDWPQGARVTTFAAECHNPAYTPIAILFEPFTAAVSGSESLGNTYEVNIRSQYLAHYTQGSMLANSAVSPPTDPDSLTKHRDHEEHKASVLEKIGQGLKAGSSWAWNHKQDLGPIIGTGWSMARPYLTSPKVVV